MHELGITRNIVAIVAEHAKGRVVQRVTLDIGKLSGVDAQAIRFCFEVVAKGTLIDGARLELRETDGRGRCRGCQAEFPTPTLYASCACGSREIERLAGEELMVREIELEADLIPDFSLSARA